VIALSGLFCLGRRWFGGKGEEEEVPGQRIEQVDWLLSPSRMPAQP
jgi:hypothetical protein